MEEQLKEENLTNEDTMSALNEKKHPKKLSGIFYILLSAFFFSLMSLFVRLSGDLPTFQKCFFRNSVAVAAAFAVLCKSKDFKIKKGNLPALLARSAVGTIGIICNFYAIDHMNISDASILNKLAPFFTIIFSILILNEKASLLEWLLVFTAFVGAIFVAKPTFDFSQSLPAFIGILGGLTAGLAYAFVRLLGNKGERGAMIVFFFSLFSSLTVLPMAIIQWQPMTWWQLIFLLFAGCAASGAQFSLTAAYKYAPAKEISVYDYSQVLFTALWGMLFLSEFPDYLSLIGYAIIIGAAVVKYIVAKKKHD